MVPLCTTFPKKVIVLAPQARIPLGSPVTALYNLASKEGKSMRKLAKEQEKDRDVESYKDKYSPDVVSRLTGLKDLELEKFMKYCSISVNLIKESTEYDIAALILEYYRKYKIEQEAKDKEIKNE
ncbi:MAG TPA: hypothetical protein VHO90_10730 [Bacteroidales bacterium]|nr:hypothetical protein [Bacteroidales bacterium]